MITKQEHTGFAIAIAWPETYCKQPGAWYDGLMCKINISKHHYYKVGHAALVLIDVATSKCYYYDFGRYHTPFQHGRVRGEISDHGLAVKTRAIISNDQQSIENVNEILSELQLNAECHGEGALHAGYCAINFNAAYDKVMQMQNRGYIPYGPFQYKGSNCSRFVNTAILAGIPLSKYAFKLKYLVPLTPTPISNVKALSQQLAIAKLLPTVAFCPIASKDKATLQKTLAMPPKHSNIPKHAQWLSGEGAGSWFALTELESEIYEFTRYSPAGTVECAGAFKEADGLLLDKNIPFQFTYTSHCKQFAILQNTQQIVFHRLA